MVDKNSITSKMLKTNKSFWDIWGKISAIIFTLAAIIGIIVSFPKKEIDLDITGDSYQYQLHPEIKKEFQNILDKCSEKYIFEKLKSYFKDKYLNENNVLEVSSLLSKDINNSINRKVFDDEVLYSEIIVINIKNNGTKTAKNLSLKIPDSGRYLIITPTTEKIDGDFKKIIKIGDINAKEKYQVFIWSGFYIGLFDDMFDGYYYAYEQGAGNIKFPYRIFGIIARIFANSKIVLIIALFILLITIVYIVYRSEKYKDGEKK